jgi:hypothetical protein
LPTSLDVNIRHLNTATEADKQGQVTMQGVNKIEG